jgi:alkanesulfonate monooxygenase SsuD/methylene tetrahydromethanopterin reductase-like flavin-dependent oxidoreductase (luciferase family)
VRFGVYSELQTPPGVAHTARFADELAAIEAADALGFDVYSLIEHHGFEQFSISANPLAVFAAAASRTARIRFRTALHTLPLQHPLRLAAEIAVADILTGGRLECGLGRGHAWLYPLTGVPFEESKPRFDEAVELLLRAWSDERFSHAGRFWTVEDAAVVPKPVQRPHPPLSTGGTSEHSYRLAGERGWALLLPPTRPYATFAPRLDVYRAASRAGGHVPHVVVIRPVYLTDDAGAARGEVEPYLHNFFLFNASPMESLTSPERVSEMAAKGFAHYASGALPALRDVSYEDAVGQGIAFVGTPDVVARGLVRFMREDGIGELAIVAAFGGLPRARVLRTQELFAKHVIPFLRAAGS